MSKPDMVLHECATLISNTGAGVALSSLSMSSKKHGECCSLHMYMLRLSDESLGETSELIRLYRRELFLSN